jgi:signal peptidase I
VKRVIGVENDLVEIRGGDVLVNGAGLVEPYVTRGSEAADTTYHFGPLKVPKGKVFVLGDNRANSEDSRMWSEPFVPLSQIIGKAVMVYWSSAQDSPVRTVL